MDKAPTTFKAGAARLCAVAVAFLAAAGPAVAAPAPLRAAVFPFELDDTSLGGAMTGSQPADLARLHRLDGQLRAALAKSGQYSAVNTAPLATQAAAQSLRTCDACATSLAQKAGAQVAVVGWVQKVSNLILNINLVVRDAASGKMLRAGSVDIRGDTDESWTRGLAYLLRHRILNRPGTDSP